MNALPRYSFSSFLLLAAAAAVTACGGSVSATGSGGHDGGTAIIITADASSVDSSVVGVLAPDAAVEVPDATSIVEDAGSDADFGAVSTTYPAFPVDIAQVVPNQGYVLKNPVIVTVTWPGDTNAGMWQAYGDGIGATSYWSAATAEYGVGPATSGASNHVALTEQAPTTISADDLAAFVAANASTATSDAGPAWPAPTLDPTSGNSQTIYALFIPSSMSVTDPGSGQSFCDEGAGGYHDDVLLPNGNPISYAVMLNCAGFGVTDVQESAAHEFAEASTDPYPSYPNTNAAPTELGWVTFDPNHLSWDLLTGFQDELGDACEFWQDSFFTLTGSFPYGVQRIWSNKAAAAGHGPCAPQAAGAYYGMTLFPAQESTISVDLSSLGFGVGSLSTLGFHAPVNKPLTFDVGFYSDAAASPWTISYDFEATQAVTNASGTNISNGAATVTIDHATGQNGEKAVVTVTPTTAGQLGYQIFAITWDPPSGNSGFAPHYLPVLLLNQ